VHPATLCPTLYQPQALDSNKHDATLPAHNSFQLILYKLGQICLKLSPLSTIEVWWEVRGLKNHHSLWIITVIDAGGILPTREPLSNISTLRKITMSVMNAATMSGIIGSCRSTKLNFIISAKGAVYFWTIGGNYMNTKLQDIISACAVYF